MNFAMLLPMITSMTLTYHRTLNVLVLLFENVTGANISNKLGF